MQTLQKHAPEMKAIQQKYKNDKQKQQEELMKFYRENKVNPAASCLPIVLQMPVFFALYFVLRHFSKHPPCPGHPGKLAEFCVRHGDFSWLGIIPDISKAATSHWSGYILLVIYVASQMASTYYMGTTMDKSQRTILLVMPIAFVFFIAHFPVGLVLYWMTTNLWVVGQGLITRRLIPKTAAPSFPKRSSRTAPAPAPPGVDESELAATVRELVERITDGIGVRCRVAVEEDEASVTAVCTGHELGVLIGRHGQTIDAIQYLTNAIVAREVEGDRKAVVVDAAGYRARRTATLEAMALRAADRARAGERVELEPMSAIERKVVHLRLQDEPGVATSSEGAEPSRYVVVHPEG